MSEEGAVGWYCLSACFSLLLHDILLSLVHLQMGKVSIFCKQFHLKSGVKEQGAIKSLTRVEQDYLLSNRGGDQPELSSEAIKQIDTIMKLGLKTCSPFRHPLTHSLQLSKLQQVPNPTSKPLAL